MLYVYSSNSVWDDDYILMLSVYSNEPPFDAGCRAKGNQIKMNFIHKAHNRNLVL